MTEPEQPESPEPTPRAWEYKTDFALNEKLKVVVHKTLDATTAEIDALKRKLDKLTYGA